MGIFGEFFRYVAGSKQGAGTAASNDSVNRTQLFFLSENELEEIVTYANIPALYSHKNAGLLRSLIADERMNGKISFARLETLLSALYHNGRMVGDDMLKISLDAKQHVLRAVREHVEQRS